MRPPNTCEFTNVVHSFFTPELLDSLAKPGIPWEAGCSISRPTTTAVDPKLTPPPSNRAMHGGGRSAAQEKPDLFEEPIASRLMLQEQMVLVLECDSGRGGCQQRAGGRLDSNTEIAPHMHYQCRSGCGRMRKSARFWQGW